MSKHRSLRIWMLLWLAMGMTTPTSNDLGDETCSTLFRSRKKGYQFLAATTKPLGDLAWDYSFNSPASKRTRQDPKAAIRASTRRQ